MAFERPVSKNIIFEFYYCYGTEDNFKSNPQELERFCFQVLASSAAYGRITRRPTLDARAFERQQTKTIFRFPIIAKAKKAKSGRVAAENVDRRLAKRATQRHGENSSA